MEIIDYFNISIKAKDSTKVRVNDIAQALECSSQEKSVLIKTISSITLVGVLTEDTIGVRKYIDEEYNYQAIYCFYVSLKEITKLSQVNELLHKAFPNPIVIIYQLNDKYAISTALKRLNKVETGKTVIEEIELSDLFKLDEIHTKLLSKIHYDFINLKELYKHWNSIVLTNTYVDLVEKVPNAIDESIKNECIKIKKLLAEKKKLEQQMKEADSMQEQMDIYMKIKKIDKVLVKNEN